MINLAIAPERAIQTSSADRLERSLFIRRLAAALINPTTGRSSGVVIGVTGPWGSGKSSILNLLQETLSAEYADALIVRFDPWLVSGRNDLIEQFLGELIGTINSSAKQFNRLKALGATIADYGAELASAGNLLKPGVGTIFSGGFKVIASALKQKKSLNTLRKNLLLELNKTPVPIVVLIDEIDRIEDDEIRTVAQLVRSVADFPGISYVLAYDTDRVIQALGAGTSDENRKERGRRYLEKIVQLQIPIPATFDDEVRRLLTSDLKALAAQLGLPNDFETIDRYRELMDLLCGEVITTLRDIQKIVGTFHVLCGMLSDEVDWIDLLAYSALLMKAPATVERMRHAPDDYLDDPSSARAIGRRMAIGSKTKKERLAELIDPAEINDGSRSLIGYIFPFFAEQHSPRADHTDALSNRRPFLTTLRLGLLPGNYTRDAVRSLLNGSNDEIQIILRRAQEDDTLAPLVDRLAELYIDLLPADQLSFWRSVGKFLRKPDCDWMRTYQPMNEIVRSFSDVYETAIRRHTGIRDQAKKVLLCLCEEGETELTAHWLRRDIFSHGLFGNDRRREAGSFLDSEECSTVSLDMSRRWRDQHISGKLISCRWNLQPVYTMVDNGVWDEECRAALNNELTNDHTVDGLSLMLFGAYFTNDRSFIKKMCDIEFYIKRVFERSEHAKSGELSESARLALTKALSELT